MPRILTSRYRILSRHGHTILADAMASTLTSALRIADSARDAYADSVTLYVDDKPTLAWSRSTEHGWSRVNP